MPDSLPQELWWLSSGRSAEAMDVMRIVIHGETPSKKNSRVNTRSGRSFPSRRYMEWHDCAVAQVLSQGAGHVPRGGRVSVTMTFWHGDRRRRDSDNQCSSVLDMLVDAGVLPDDSWAVVPEKHIYDRHEAGKARVEIEIWEI